ncbi:MAG: hypothetical protein AB7U31_07475, partial [Synergistaceae bacterium]
MKRINIAIITISILLMAGPLFAENAEVLSDTDLREGKWIEMAHRYPITAMSGDVLSEPDPKVLAKWWESLNDEILT